MMGEAKRKWAVQDKWKAANTKKITIRLFKTTDADVLEMLGDNVTSTEVKRLLRIAIKAIKEQGE